MRIKGEVIDAQYKTGVSKRTGNSYELTEYVLQSTDEQGHSHKMTFTLSGERMYQEKVHKGDKVEVSIQLGIREWNGNRFNEVVACYFVQKLNADGTTTKEALIQQQAEKTAQLEAAQAAAPVEIGKLPF